MLRNENIICISSIDWDFNWQGHQEIMATLTKNENRVLFIENTGVRPPGIRDIPRIKKRLRDWHKGVGGIRREGERLYILSPVIFPFQYSRVFRMINRRLLLPVLKKWMDIMDFHDPIIWSFLPTGVALDIIDNLDKKLVIYYCIANFSELVNNKKALEAAEKALLRKADMVFVQDEFLKRRCLTHNKNVELFPFGVGSSFFVDRAHRRPAELSSVKRPIIGYVGGIHKWIDQELVRACALSHPDSSFVFVGPIQTDIGRLEDIKNIYFLGQKAYKDLPDYINCFDAAIIPYTVTDYTLNVYPTKLNEYLALGKPVISTDLPEVKNFNKTNGEVVKVSSNKEGFIEAIREILREDSHTLKGLRIDAAKNNVWDRRLEEMCGKIEEAIEEKKRQKDKFWAYLFRELYRRYRKKVFRLAFSISILWLILFHTPFAWFFPRPLKISQPPEKADCVVVFGGGVGETGSPGKSTIERARYSAQLYEKGFAGHIIYSSGYTYTSNDAENMSLIAASKGVPSERIILEDKANSTYENVIYVKAILDKKGWGKILLVTSPYNNRRAALVFNKIAPRIKVIYTPVARPQFFEPKGQGGAMGLEQFKAIIHEYLGILYYKLKGYI